MKNYYFLFLLVLMFIPFQLMAQTWELTSPLLDLIAITGEYYKRDGIASWYGREFEGRPTASEEIIDSTKLTAAHPILPFGTMLTVTNQHNNKSVVVRVNDRIPSSSIVAIIVSRAAAEQLDIIDTGNAIVSIISNDRNPIKYDDISQIKFPETRNEVTLKRPVSPSNPPKKEITNEPTTEKGIVSSPVRLYPEMNIVPDKFYRLQVGTFKNIKDNVYYFDKLKSAGLNPVYESGTLADNSEYYHIVLARVCGSDIQDTKNKLITAGCSEAFIREEK